MWRFVVLRWASYEELYHHFYYSSDQLRYVRMKEKPHHYHVLSAIAVLYSVLYSVQLDNTLKTFPGSILVLLSVTLSIE